MGSARFSGAPETSQGLGRERLDQACGFRCVGVPDVSSPSEALAGWMQV